MSEAGVRKPELAILAALLLLASALSLTRLGNGSLWQDEAQTALVSRTILSHGIPLGTDGLNFFSQENGAEYGPGHVWRWHTWFPFYLQAAVFALLGESTFSARLPFALFGIATVLVAFVLGRELYRSRRAGAVAGLLLATSVPFLLLSRQSRYYSVAACFTLLALLYHRRVVDGAGRRAGALLVTALVLLFHTHYVYYFALLPALLADAVLLQRGSFKRVALLCGLSLLLNLPWIVWMSTMPYAEQYDTLSVPRAAGLGLSFGWQIEAYVVPRLLLLVPIVLVFIPRRRTPAPPAPSAPPPDPTWKRVAPLVLFTTSCLGVLSLSAPAPFFRYLAPLLPICCVLMAWIVEAAALRHWALGLAVLGGLLAFQAPRLADFADELRYDFEGPVDGIVRHLQAHAQPSDVVAITYDDLPLKFYTPLRVVGGLTGEDLAPARDATWVIVRKHVVSDKDEKVRDYLLANLPLAEFESIRLDSPDTEFQNRESPDEHRFRSAVGEEGVVILRRRAP